MAIVAARRPRARDIGDARAALRDLQLAHRLQTPHAWHDAELILRATTPLKPSIELKETS
jgi:hypothetical protein